MLKTTVNLTASTVIEEIDNLLAAYPDSHAYQRAIKNPQFRRQLITFVLDKIPSKYAALEDEQGRRIYPDFQSACLEKRLKIEEVIQKGFRELLVSQNV